MVYYIIRVFCHKMSAPFLVIHTSLEIFSFLKLLLGILEFTASVLRPHSVTDKTCASTQKGRDIKMQKGSKEQYGAQQDSKQNDMYLRWTLREC